MDIIANKIELKKWCLALICLFALPLTIVSQDESGIITASLDIPLPQKDISEQILRRTGYVVSYNADLRIPNWVAWHLTAEHVKGAVSRPGPSSDGNDDKASLRRVIKQGKEAHEKAKKLAGDWGWVGEDCPEQLLDMEMTDKGLRAKQCDVYRMYGFDNTTITFDGEHLTVNEGADDELSPENQIRLFLHLDQNGDLVGDCSISHRLASKGYNGQIRLRKGYFMYRDGVKKNYQITQNNMKKMAITYQGYSRPLSLHATLHTFRLEKVL